MAHLFTPYTLRGMTLQNRIVMAPMCQYSVTAKDGRPNDWHYTHLTSRAVGGAGLVLFEMTDVEPDGRITDEDLGLWSDEQIPQFARIVEACHTYGAKVGIQLAHAGRKAMDAAEPVAPSAIRYDADGYKTPRALSTGETEDVVQMFQAAAKRAVVAGVDTIELHGAHGYLIHQFQSPLTNHRTDRYGQDLAQFGVEVVRAVKEAIPSTMPLFMRVSAVEYADGGYDLEHCLEICRKYRTAGVDMFHVSSGGEGRAGARRPGNYPGYQIPFARTIKNELGVPVTAVGMLEDAQLAESVVANADADLVAIGRGMLRDPYWAIHAAQALGVEPTVPQQYERAF